MQSATMNRTGNTIAKGWSSSILTDVRFGMISKNCRNFGICEVRKVNNRQSRVGRGKKKMLCTIEVMNRSKLRFSFESNSITTEGSDKYFGRHYFEMGEAYTIVAEIAFELTGIFKCITLLPGRYPITRSKKMKIVLFDFEN